MTTTRAELYASDKGRTAALMYWTAKRAWPLATRPENPYDCSYGSEFLTWQLTFDATVARLDGAK